MDTERLGGARLWTMAAAALLFYALAGFLAFRNWRARHEAKAIIALTEKYRRTQVHLPACDCGLGVDEQHAFWSTAYWWHPEKFKELRQ